MISPKFILILKSLNTDDFKLLGKFLQAPLHNTNKNILNLYRYLKQLCPDYNSEKLALEVIHKKIFPGKKYNEKVIRNLLYEFIGLVEDYFSYLNYSKDKFAIQKHLLQETLERRINRLVKESLEKADEFLADEKIKDDQFYSNKAFIEQLRYELEIKKIPYGKSLVLSNIKSEYIRDVSSYFMLVILKEYFDKKNSETQIKSNTELRLAELILEFLDKEIDSYKNDPIIYLFYHFLKLDNNTGDEQFFTLKELTTSGKEKISKSYFRDFILMLYNFCKEKERTGDKKYGHESFTLLKYMIENNLLAENDGSILEHNYTNTIATGIRLNEIEWTIQFIDTYKTRLPDALRESAYCYNMAVVHFRKASNSKGTEKMAQLDHALDYLGKVKTEDFFQTIRIDNLELMIFYEKGDYEPAFSLIDSYRHYLRNNNLISDALKKRYSNFTNFTGRMMNIKSGSGKGSIEKLRMDILKSETEYKNWLLSKADEIIDQN